MKVEKRKKTVKKQGKEEAEKAKKAREKRCGKSFFFFARRWSQLSTSVISPSLNLVSHQVLRYHSSRVTLQVVMWLFLSFVSLLPAAQRKTHTEMPTVTSLSKRMIERFVSVVSHNSFSFFRLPVSLDSAFTHIMTRLRAVALAAVMSLALLAQGGPVRFGERGSRRVKWFRLGEIGGMTTKASSRDWSSW